ncbi:right-handed parallel beta-helix repeat-containing protein [Dasania marina]|uniref:right-handed parallel beta-helix repeat-containing protein n=1 Tax=Dasania marina TaxID=471499 RepID=UPI00037CC49E|nr:right-handed parallel beta-helix repeat-containing protein [Dasania marina]
MQVVVLTVITSIMLVGCGFNQKTDIQPKTSDAEAIIVCPEKRSTIACDFFGEDAIQRAVDAAQIGSVLLLKSGVYKPRSYRETPLHELMIRGFTVIENKSLTILGESDVVINGSLGAASAFVTKNSKVIFKNIHLDDFRWGIQEDDTYDGHGIFIIGGEVTIANISMEKIQKMALTTYGNARVVATDLKVSNSHLGVWANETSSIKLEASYFHGSESAGVSAYDKSRVTISNSIFEANQDDGIYASDEASIIITGSVIIDNKPFGINADKNGRVEIDESYVSDNEKDINTTADGLIVGDNMLSANPRLSVN